MKVIIIGAGGYIGSNIAAYFREKGVSLVLYDRPAASNCVDLASGTAFLPLDISDTHAIQRIDWDVDAVILLAGLTGTHQSIENAAEYIKVNEIGLVNVLQAIVQSGAKPHFLYPSTRLVYKGKKGLITEEDEKEARTVYAANKLSAEQLLHLYAGYYGIIHTVFRICVPYGNLVDVPFSFGTVGFMMRQAAQGVIQLYGEGEPRRTFTHIEDISSVFFSAIHNAKFYHETFNIGGEDLSLKEVADLLSVKTGAQIVFKEWPQRDCLIESGDTVFDAAKLESVVGRVSTHRIKDWINGQLIHA
jgi:UDP-glucose 4-epimerase